MGRATRDIFRAGRALLLGLIAAAACSCGRSSGDAGSEDAAEGARQALSARLAAGQILLDARSDGAALIGRPIPVVPNADPDRVVELTAPGLEATLPERALDARFVEGPDGAAAVILIGLDHGLWLHPQGGPPERLDEGAYGPLSVEGSRIAYVRGEPPFLEVGLADARTGAVEQLTHGRAPTWNPALSEDGQTVYFVSGASGGPKLLELRSGGEPRRISTSRVPTSAVAPRVVGGELIFEDESGVVWLDPRRGRITRQASSERGLAFLADGTVVDGSLSALGGSR